MVPGLYRELSDDGNRVTFRMGTRLAGFVHVLGGAMLLIIGVGLLTWDFRDQESRQPLIAVGCILFGLMLLVPGMWTIWSIRAMIIDREGRTVRILERSPGRRDEQTIAFRDLRDVCVEVDGRGKGSSWKAMLRLRNGSEFPLGNHGSWQKTRDLARRVAAVAHTRLAPDSK